MLARNPERDLTRREKPEAGAPVKELRHERPAAVDEMLGVIEDEKCRLRPDRPRERNVHRLATALPDAERGRHGRADEVLVGGSDEGHEPASGAELGRSPPDLDRDPGLAGPARSGNCDKAGGRQQRPDLGLLPPSADERRERHREAGSLGNAVDRRESARRRWYDAG